MPKRRNTFNSSKTTGELSLELGIHKSTLDKWLKIDKVCGEPQSLPRGSRNAYLVSEENARIISYLSRVGLLGILSNKWQQKTIADIYNAEQEGEIKYALMEIDALFNDINSFLDSVREERDRLHELIYGVENSELGNF